MPAINPLLPKTAARKKFLLVVSFYDGDHKEAISLLNLIANLEDKVHEGVDLLLYRRNDAKPIEQHIVNKLLEKFSNVEQLKCRRGNAGGYPTGPNEMWYDLVEAMRREEFRTNYYAWLNMETDCCPLRPGWLDALIAEYKKWAGEGYAAVGHIHSHPKDHLNGAAIYAVDFFDRAGGMNLLGGPHNTSYDFQHAETIVPVSRDTPLMLLDFNRKTITKEDFEDIRKHGKRPVFLHGVKDESVRMIVRSKYLGNEVKDLSDVTIQTFFWAVPGIREDEERASIEVWKEAWRAQGWNPVVNNVYDAYKHPKYEALKNRIHSFPTINPGNYDHACFLRWLAFDYHGAGFQVDYDVLPRPGFTPKAFQKAKKFTILQSRSHGKVLHVVPSFVHTDKASLNRWIDYVINLSDNKMRTFKESGRDHVSDMHLLADLATLPVMPSWLDTKDLCREVGEKGWERAKAVHFAHGAVKKYSPGVPRSRVMAEWASEAL